jgi:hypothetical protein
MEAKSIERGVKAKSIERGMEASFSSRRRYKSLWRASITEAAPPITPVPANGEETRHKERRATMELAEGQ